MHRADNRSNKDEKADNQKYSIEAAEVRHATSLKSHSVLFCSIYFENRNVLKKKLTECYLKSFLLDYCVFYVVNIFSSFYIFFPQQPYVSVCVMVFFILGFVSCCCFSSVASSQFSPNCMTEQFSRGGKDEAAPITLQSTITSRKNSVRTK